MTEFPVWVAVPISLLLGLVLFDSAFRTAALITWARVGPDPARGIKLKLWTVVRVLLLALIAWGVGTFGLDYLPMPLRWISVAVVVAGGVFVGTVGILRNRSRSADIEDLSV